jgi:hypothetical protein
VYRSAPTKNQTSNPPKRLPPTDHSSTELRDDLFRPAIKPIKTTVKTMKTVINKAVKFPCISQDSLLISVVDKSQMCIMALKRSIETAKIEGRVILKQSGRCD